ncbi:MAG: metallophosphoesterase family protein [Gaiellaceae bacterium]
MSTTARRVAVLSDIHGNAVALEAVLAEVAADPPDLIVLGGDATWGPLPRETAALLRRPPAPTVLVRGNAERALFELLEDPTRAEKPREQWMLEAHSDDDRAFLRGAVEGATVDVAGLGPVRFCHGSPRSDEELITYATPDERLLEAVADRPERVVVSAHTHLQFDRRVAGIRSVNPGSVGMPYMGQPGAFWARLGPDVELRRTEYDVDEAVRRYRETDDPLVEQMVEILLSPPTPDEVIEDEKRHAFAG